MLETRRIILLVFLLPWPARPSDDVHAEMEKMINSSIKASVWPCEDFYNYACGNHDNQTDLFEQANHQHNMALISVLESYEREEEQRPKGDNCQTLAEKVRNYYESCCKVVASNLTRFLEEMKPGPELNWPILENESSQLSLWPHGKEFDVLYLLGKLKSIGIAHMLYIDVMPSSGIFIQYYNNSEPLTALTVENILQQLLPSEAQGTRLRLLRDIMDTNRIMQNMWDETETEAESRIFLSFGVLVKRYPNLNFKAYLKESLGLQLPSNTRVLLYSPSFLQKLNDNLWLKFDKAKLSNYLMMFYLRAFEPLAEFSNMTCLNHTRTMFNLALNFLYYQHYNDTLETFVKPDVFHIFKTLVDMLSKHLQSSELDLTVYQIQHLKETLAGIRLNIGDLPENATCKQVEGLYASLPSLDANNFYRNHLLALRFIVPRFFSRHMIPSSFGAAKIDNTQPNTITLNYAYLMPPIYSVGYNNLSKYGLLGFVLAQNLVHHCNLMSLNHWHTTNNLRSAIECLIPPPYKYVYERLDDNVATEIIRKAVTLKFYNLQPISTLPAWKQQLFLHVAQHYCHLDNNPGKLYDSPSVRLNRLAMNSEGFSQAFSCPQEAKMNSKEKCQI